MNLPISEAEIEAIIEGHEARNAALSQLLIERGVNLREARKIECHFWSWTEINAANLAEDLARKGFQILVRARTRSANDPHLWNVEAAITQPVDLTVGREFTTELVRIAASHFGRYDGWGTRI